MTAAKVCQLREDFLTEWRKEYPTVASPVIRGLGDLNKDDVIDESQASGHVLSVRESLNTVNEKITQLREKIRSKLFFKQFLIRVLQVLDSHCDASDLLADVATQLAGVNTVDVPLSEVHTCGRGVRSQPATNRETHSRVQGQSAEVSGCNSHARENKCVDPMSKDRSTVTYTHKERPATDTKATESSRFVSYVNVTEKSKSRSAKQVETSDLRSKDLCDHDSKSKTKNCDSVKDENYDDDTLGYDNLMSCEEDQKMFRRKKGNITKPGGGEIGPHNLVSKDNFLAVTSKHIAPTDIPKHQEGITNAPHGPRNFQLLRLTSGFDIVLDEKTTDKDDRYEGKGDKKTAEDEREHKPVRDCDSGRGSPKSEEAKNREFLPDDVTPSSAPQENVSTKPIHVRNPAFCEGQEDKIGGVQSHSRLSSTGTDAYARQRKLGQNVVKQSSESSMEVCAENSNRSASEEAAASAAGTAAGEEDRMKTLPGKPGSIRRPPPPVAKKPSKPGSGKKLPSAPEGVKPVLRPGEVAPGNDSDINVNSGSNNVDSPGEGKVTPQVSKKFREETDVEKTCSESGEERPSRDRAECVGQQNRFSALMDKTKPQPSAPLLNELKSKCSDRESGMEQSEGSAGVKTDDNASGHSSASATFPAGVSSDRDFGEKLRVSPGIVRNNVGRFSGGKDQISNSSVGKLVKETRSSIGSVLEKMYLSQNLDTAEVNNSSSQRDVHASSIPPRQTSDNHIKTSTSPVEVDGAGDDQDIQYSRMTSSNSSDTIVEFGRKQSFSFDADVNDAVSALDCVIISEISATEDTPDKQNQKLQPTERKSSTRSYEGWTVNRAITMYINKEDFLSISDDDDMDEVSSSSASVSPSLKRPGSSRGSKDSGLCDDIGASEVAQSDATSAGAFDMAGGRIRDLRTLQQMESCAEEDDVSPEQFGEKDMDNISVTSDIVFIPGSRSSRDYGTNSQGRHSVEKFDSVSINSSGEEEACTTMDSSYDETDSARDGMLKMRQLLVKGVLDSEKVYLDILSILIQYKRSLEASSASSQPLVSKEDIAIIFSDIEKIHDIHKKFVTSLEPKVRDWTREEEIGEIFKIMISKFIDFGNYLNNYQQAVNTIHRCSQENEQFQELVQQIIVTSTIKEVTSLEDALFKPVQRVQRNTLVLHDLIKYTPEDHPDHQALQRALKLSHHILETFATAIPQTPTTQENRRLVKSSFLVELVNGIRKLRYMFLFSDVLVCTKRQTHRNKMTFDIKWFAPLSHTNIDTKSAYTDDTKFSKKDDIDELKGKIRTLKKEMRAEMRKYDDKDQKHRSIVSIGGTTRLLEKLQKKINHYEAQLIMASPKLPFKVALDGGKVYTILMTTEYEREEWKETIAALCMRTNQQQAPMSSIFIQDLINSVKETPQVNKIGNVLMEKDEDILTGTLNVTIHKMNGLTQECDTYCCLEMDSFGHFFMKARTHICEGTRDPAWNEDFELELDGSQTLRILCFKKEATEHGDKMLGRGALELSRHWLKNSFQEKTISMNEISLVISVRHTPAEKTMQRTPSRSTQGVFGVKISTCARREGKTMPTIVTACVQEVEKRGLDEVGIYRVSGVTSDLQRIKKIFDKNSKTGAMALADLDIHAVTGVLKLYLRELPEPLFTEANYQNFVDSLSISDEEARAQCMLSLLHGLPDTNYYTTVYLLEHLLKVARNVGDNRMSIHNLATVFGPTLLAPASKQTSDDPLEMMCKGAEQVMRQSGVISYLLGLAVSGRSLRRSAQ